MIIHKSKDYVKFLNKKIIKNNGMIGSTLYSNSCGKFTVLKKYKKENNHYLFKIIFINTDEKYVVRGDRIINGEVKDYMAKTIMGIACLGKDYLKIRENDAQLCKCMLKRYRCMLERCYSKHSHNYKFYGALGVRVDYRWHNFCNYYYDIINLPNFNRELFISKKLIIDKDIKQINLDHNKRIYSKDTVLLVTEAENLKYRNLKNCGKITANKKSKYFAMITTDGFISYHKNICELARNLGISDSSIRDSIHNRTNIVYNKLKFRFLSNEEKQKIKNNEIILNKKYRVNL